MRIKAMKSHLIAMLIAVLGLAALPAGPARAADITLRKAPAVAPEDPWYGLYLGVAGGWGWGSSSHDTSIGPSSGSFNQNGWIVGGVGGFNWHPGAIVIGVEGDISAADIDGTSAPGACVNPCETKVGWLYTGRVRLGLPVGTFMPYVTAGGAAAGLRASEGFNPTAATPHIWGWVAGGGIELMAVSRLSLRAEYLHAGFVNSVEASDMPGGFLPAQPVVSVKERGLDVFRAGLTYYLGSDRGIAP